jgi:hypothetical protein
MQHLICATNDRERESGEDFDNMEEVGKALTWTRQQWMWCGVEVGMGEEQARGVDPTMIGEAVDEAPVWTR